MNTPSRSTNRVSTSYLLWLAMFIGFSGLHRFYNGKIGTGLLWFCTWGIFGIGQFVDLFLIPNMVEEYEVKLRLKHGLLPGGVPMTPNIAPTDVVKPEKLIIRIIKAAERRGGKLTVTQAVLETGADFNEVEEALKDLVKKGCANIDNDPIKGTVIYDFVEL